MLKCFFFFFIVLEKIKRIISYELSALIKFCFFLNNKKFNTQLELYFIFPLLGKGLFSKR